jgi:hypothetical protein
LGVNSDGTIKTVEGNTSLKSSDNGGAVMLRTRNISDVVCAVRPEYAPEKILERNEDDTTIEEITSIAGTGDAHSSWADEAISAVTKAGIINGDGQGNYGWQVPITRQAAAQIIYNLLKKLGLTEAFA